MKRDQTAPLHRITRSLRFLLLCSSVFLPIAALPVLADDTGVVTQEDLKLLKQQLELQKQELENQKQALQQQQNQLNFLKSQVGQSDDPDTTPVTFNLGNGTFTTGNAGSGATAGSNSGVVTAQDNSSGSTGTEEESPDDTETRLSQVLDNETGVLTPEGTLVVEPSLEFTHSTSNRFFAQGVEVVDSVFIGLLEVNEADRDTVTAGLNIRYGITDRFEMETRIPYVFRHETVTQSFISQPNQPSFSDTNNGDDIGDIEVAGHYQITSAPIYTVANVRVNTPTGLSPFDADFDPITGQPTELATGSGFWGVQPSVTVIFPTDPVVFFGTFGYTINIPDDVNEVRTISDPTSAVLPITSTIGDVDPGDSINIALGMGLSLNEQFSMSLGFKYDYVFPTEEEVVILDSNPGGPSNFTGTVETDTLQAASFLVGWSYQVNEMVGLNLNFEVGATDDANDFAVRVGVPIRFNNLFGRGEEE
ncbi:MAG TPA: hypothetical protein VMT98_08025 [Verrucomicrobiae bacterium]|nr:hypothetical protein [Verrucomicrobiae bacterium]